MSHMNVNGSGVEQDVISVGSNKFPQHILKYVIDQALRDCWSARVHISLHNTHTDQR